MYHLIYLCPFVAAACQFLQFTIYIKYIKLCSTLPKHFHHISQFWLQLKCNDSNIRKHLRVLWCHLLDTVEHFNCENNNSQFYRIIVLLCMLFFFKKPPLCMNVYRFNIALRIRWCLPWASTHVYKGILCFWIPWFTPSVWKLHRGLWLVAEQRRAPAKEKRRRVAGRNCKSVLWVWDVLRRVRV